MGRIIIACLVVACALTGCGAEPNLPQVGGPLWARPTVRIPDGEPAHEPVIRVLREGDGPPVEKGQVAIVQYELRTWKDNRKVASSHTKNAPMTVIMDGRHLAPTWTKALTGRPAGSRVLLVTPASQGFGPHGMPPVGTSPADTIVAVFDVIGSYSPTAQVEGPDGHPPADGLPGVAFNSGQKPATPSGGDARRPMSLNVGVAPAFTAMPKERAPTDLVVKRLIAGSGPVVTEDTQVVLQYASAQWGRRKPYVSSRQLGGPDAFVFGEKSMPPGWRDALVGRRVGDRVMLAVPARMNEALQMTSGGIPVPPTASVHVLDILDAVKGRSS